MKRYFSKTKLIIAVIILSSLALGLSQYFKYRTDLKDVIVLATSPKPEVFTELYFDNHFDLPKTIESNNVYNFTFTVHNMEGVKTEYPYSVYILTDTKKVTLEEGSFNLDTDEYKSVKVEYGPLLQTKMKIVVDLTNKNQQIAFWMNKQE